MLADLGRCGAPCDGRQSEQDYAQVVAEAVDLITGDARRGVGALRARMAELAEQERFEDAGAVRDRFTALVRGTARAQRLAPLSAIPELIAARRREAGGWELVCVRFGRFAGTALSPRGADPMPYVDSLQATAEVVEPPVALAPAALIEETEIVLAWLEQPGVRMVVVDGEWSCPTHGMGATRTTLAG